VTKQIEHVSEAAAILRAGGIVAFPTETVYGLGARFDDPQAVAKIFAAKGRPSDNPLIVHCSDMHQIDALCETLSTDAQSLLRAFSPGPVTVVLRRSEQISDQVSGGLTTVAVRIPSHAMARQLIREVGVPLVAPSANRSGRPSPTTWEAVWEDLHDRIDGVLLGEPTTVGLESTVVDCSQSPPYLLRTGAVTAEQLRAHLPNLVDRELSHERAKRSPGTRYRHYAPEAKVVLFSCWSETVASAQSGCLALEASPESSRYAMAVRYASTEDYARDLYEALRRADRMGLKVIYCQKVSPEGIGRALLDRLQRASEEAR
jgi:L-threonylcarbamoyladenylate synthase